MLTDCSVVPEAEGAIGQSASGGKALMAPFVFSAALNARSRCDHADNDENAGVAMGLLLVQTGRDTMIKLVVSSIVLVLVTLGGSNRSMGEQVQTPRGELRIVDKHPWNWVWITFNVLEHLMDFDKDGTLVPRLATDWRWLDDRTLEVALRHGVTFHNGERFDAEIVQLNWDENFRLRQPHMSGEYMNFTPGSRLEIINPQTVRFVFPEPDGGALVKLSNMHIANRQF
jgi:ABC-type transport system substrate-binding protein